jgi:hypothetical protein
VDRDLARCALKAASETLDSLQADWWIDCGTLLGAIREGEFLAHDQDVDLSCWDWDAAQEIEAAFVDAGFARRMTFGVPEHGYEQSFLFDDLKLDIFFFYEEGAMSWQGSWLGDHLFVSRFRTSDISPSRPWVFQGMDVRVPHNAAAVLAARYGDWRTPVRKWDWTTDPRCITAESRL